MAEVMHSELRVNRAVANRFGLALPQAVRARATRVID